MRTRDYLRLVERHFPAAFAACCSCARPDATNSSLPCYALSHLWTPCFRAHAGPPRRLASFLVDVLGVFGLFGNEIDGVPAEVLRADHRLSWVVNNAYNWKAAGQFAHATTATISSGGGGASSTARAGRRARVAE